MGEAKSLFNEKHSLAIRSWHWTFFVFISASIGMVILASTLFYTSDNVDMVQEQVKERGGSVSQEQARGVAHEFNDKLWEAHTWLGYGLCLLLFSRIVIEISASKEERLRQKIKRALQFNSANASEKKDRVDYLLAKYGYLLFYALILVMALTGLVLAFEDVPFCKEIRRPVKSIHSFVQWGIYGYIFLHLAGVTRAELRLSKGIVSRMIHGKAE